MKKALGIDIGGTKMLYSVLDETGAILSEIKRCSTPKTTKEIVTLLKDIITEYQDEIDAVGLSSAGAVNIDNTRVVSSTPNLPDGYNDIDFSILSDKKVFVENDANCAVWAEYKSGAGKGYKTVLIATIGTGIGGGLVSNGVLFRGATGNALEVGSMKIFADKRQQCNCGRYDCWESYASGTGLKNCAKYGALNYPEFKESIFCTKLPDEVSSYDILDGVNQNDFFSKKVFEQWIEYMCLGLTNLTNIFNPDCIVISGGLCEYIDMNYLQDKINSESVVSPVVVKMATTKNNAGMIGAGLLALS